MNQFDFEPVQKRFRYRREKSRLQIKPFFYITTLQLIT